MTNYLEAGLRTVIGYLVPLYEASLRLQLGRSMVMGLEFLVAADILRTALYPTWNEMLGSR